MKSILQCLAITSLASFVLAGSSSPRQALIYTYDTTSTESKKQGTTIVSLDELQLIVDRRLGTNNAKSIGKDASEDLLQDLNTYGGKQRALLADTNPPLVRKMGIVLEGWDFTASDLQSPSITPTLQAQDTRGEALFWDMITTSQSGGWCSFSQNSKSGLKMGVQLKVMSCGGVGDGTQILSDSSEVAIIGDFIKFVTLSDGALVRLSFPKHSNHRILEFLDTFHNIASEAAKAETTETTILVVQSLRSSRKSNTLLPRSLPQEEPLDTSLPAQTNDFLAPIVAANYTPLPISNTKIPRCFASLSACQSTTNNCSTHGQCTLYHSVTSGDDPSGSDCWSCTCGKTSSGNGKGGIVNWGGNACQKKDISVPFWLFAGFAISMTAGIAGAIGMLYGMGSQDLPGVLGAGVGGSKAPR